MKPGASSDWWHWSLFWTLLVPHDLAKKIATLGPIGYRLPAPGTWGSLLGVFYYLAFFHPLHWTWQVFLSVIGFYLTVGFCDKGEKTIGRRDPGEIVLDEFIVMPVCLLGTHGLWPEQQYWMVLLAAFVIFRFFDILKPLGIKKLQNFPGGWGIVIDDLAAALATLLTLHLALFLWRWL